MRLIKINVDGTLSLTKDLHDSSIPQYAIVSHTWGADDQEVTYQDLCKGTGREKTGYEKLDFCVQQAKKDGLEFCWIDTCCIDKANLTELSEALNSMFRWYSKAEVYYVYLPDVTCLKRNPEGSSDMLWEPAFRQSRWFSRGWTLQELLAPESLHFFSREGHLLGSRKALEVTIQQITTIPVAALQGKPLSSWSVEERMRWRAKRITKRKEDEVYSLLGLFGVHMNPIYGEGEHAWVRLKDEISKSFRSRLDEPPGLGSEAHPEQQIDGQDLLASLSNLNKWRLGARLSRKRTPPPSWLDAGKVDSHASVLWINGKPGCGKSTLMKYLHSCAEQTRSQNENVLGFYFNARGNELEKTTLGMYQSLLYQMTTQLHRLQDTLAAVTRRPGHSHFSGNWTIDLLQEVWMAIAERMSGSQLRLFIDALDECEEQQVREIIIFFEDLAEKARGQECQLNICFASRHYPAIDIRSGGKIIVEEEDGHDGDLVKYVNRHLRSGSGKQVESIKKEICEKANGVFLWAVLVVDILNAEHRNGRIHAVKKRLKEIPPELSELFISIIERDSTNMDELLLSLQWVLFAKRPLGRAEFYFAMVAGLDPSEESLSEWDQEHVTIESMTTYVQTSSRGFAELTRSKQPTVQFIHESVRDFLLKDGGLIKLSSYPTTSPECLGHERLRQSCHSYMANRSAMALRQYKANTQEAKDVRAHWQIRLPFLEYAVQHILYHSDQAAPAIDQGNFLREFDLRAWIRISNMFEKYEIRRYGDGARLVYILAARDHAALLSLPSRQGGPLCEPGDEHWVYPLFAAVANKSRAALHVLLQSESHPKPDVDAVLEESRSADLSNLKKSGPLLWALRRGQKMLTELLLAIPCCVSSDLLDVDRNRNTLQNAVNLAAQRGWQGAVEKLLCATRWTIVNKEEEMMLLMSHAGGAGSLATIRAIWLRCAEAGMPGLHLASALKKAAGGGHKDVVQQLLEWYADVNATFQGITALNEAAYNGHHEIADLLLASGADVNAMAHATATIEKGTALYWATSLGHIETVKVLLAHGARVWTVNDKGDSAIKRAADGGNIGILRSVLAAGATTNDGVMHMKEVLLSYSVCWWSQQCIKTLVDSGARVDVTDSFGNTPLHKIVGWDVPDFEEIAKIVSYLVQMGGNIEARNQKGQPPLLLAAEHRSWKAARILIEHGADMNTWDNEGRTIRDFASEGHLRILGLLA